MRAARQDIQGLYAENRKLRVQNEALRRMGRRSPLAWGMCSGGWRIEIDVFLLGYIQMLVEGVGRVVRRRGL